MAMHGAAGDPAQAYEPLLWERRVHWDGRARRYDEDFDAAPVRSTVLDRFVELLPDCDHLTILDAGTGTGRVARHFGEHCERRAGVHVVATDISFGMLTTASGLAPHDHPGTWVAADHARLPFRDGSFDVVVSAFTLHHIPPSQQLVALAEFRRVVRTGGLVLVADEVQADPPLPPDQMRAVVARTFYPHLHPSDGIDRLARFGEWPLAVAALCGLMARAGLRVEVAERVDPIVAVLRGTA